MQERYQKKKWSVQEHHHPFLYCWTLDVLGVIWKGIEIIGKKEKGPESISVLGILMETKEIKEKRGDQRSDMSYSRYRVKSSTKRWWNWERLCLLLFFYGAQENEARIPWQFYNVNRDFLNILRFSSIVIKTYTITLL